ncbi:MAG: hypothetical protein KDI15_02810 [Thiothrix sp.]|nr:hypothetical protein [Thiothrix sp.]HPE61575.1 protoglobin domain-containing protein [Thiolinea sp.]
MDEQALIELCAYAKKFAQLDEAKIRLLQEIHPALAPRLDEVTDAFYRHLPTIDKARPFLEGREVSLKATHREWLESLFTGQFDLDYTRHLYKVGDVHVKIRLPVEFMAGGMTIIQGELMRLTSSVFAGQPGQLLDINAAINAATGFSLLVMQESYQSSSMAAELERFLQITGISPTLFKNLARAYHLKRS